MAHGVAGRDASPDPGGARTHAGIASAYPRNAVTPKRLTGPRPGGRSRWSSPRGRRPGGSVGSRRARNDATMLLHVYGFIGTIAASRPIAPRIPSVDLRGPGTLFSVLSKPNSY